VDGAASRTIQDIGIEVSRRKSQRPEAAENPRTILVRGARQLLTMRGSEGAARGAEMRSLGMIADGAILIVDGVIQEVGPSRRVEMLAAAREAEELDASGRVVMPGFVDCQTHLLAPPAPLDDYETRCLKGKFPPPEERGHSAMDAVRVMRGYSAQRLEMEGKRQLRTMWRYGTTSLGSTSGAGLDDVSELRALRVLDGLDERPVRIVPSFGGALGVAPEYASRAAEYAAWLCADILPLLARKKLVHRVDVAVGEDGLPEEVAALYVEAARALGMAVHFRMRGDASRISPGVMSVSGIRHLSQPVATLAAEAAVAVLTPGACFHQGCEEMEPARALIDAGLAVALSTAYHPEESPTPSMPMVVSLACSRSGMTPAEALVASTINAAHALGVAGDAGSLEVGKSADLLIMNASDYREIPLYLGVNPVMMALRRGQVIYPRLESV